MVMAIKLNQWMVCITEDEHREVFEVERPVFYAGSRDQWKMHACKGRENNIGVLFYYLQKCPSPMDYEGSRL